MLAAATLILMESQLDLLSPWIKPYSPDGVACELRREVGYDHPLFSKSVKALAVAEDRDDVLFEVHDGASVRHAVVHLTWSGKTEPNAKFPKAQFFVAHWIAWMKADHDDYAHGA
jgi:hypothetical protein